ncbi:MAG TPA: saccharopine dehydrogenase C-terminal domain-containing protein, partial [Saprospiraceae bacterium]|nr:saccharopine dehydrogenase C-terminal domain-containing protein [Saprospiraceae bacterium]
PDMGQWEVYANRDSLLYREAYGLQDIRTLFRGTIRHRGFCDAWNALVRIGLTDASFPIVDSDQLSYHDLMEAFLGISQHTGSVKDRIAKMLETEPDSEVMQKLEWLGLFSKKRITVKNATPSLILENLLLDKWALQQGERDMVIMQHVFEYELQRKKRKLTSTLIMKGEDNTNTAMSKLVGLPLGIFVKLLMLGKVSTTGVSIPTMPEVYEPVMAELEDYGVKFIEQEEEASAHAPFCLSLLSFCVMHHLLLIAVAIFAGAILPVQAGLNARMGHIVGQPAVSALISFVVGIAGLLIYILVSRVPLNAFSLATQAPKFLWSAGLLGAFYVTAMVLLVPKLGMALSFGLVVAGQMLCSLVMDHYGWLGSPVQPISFLRVVGVACIVLGVVLVRRF